MKRKNLFFCLLIGPCLFACCTGPPQPVDIEPGDMCSRCRMAISEKRFAAEFIDSEGEIRKFDDLGCLLGFQKAVPNPRSDLETFVMDFHTRTWIKAREAYFLQSALLKTPMGGGIAAWGDRAAAEESARQFGGRLLNFAELQQAFQ